MASSTDDGITHAPMQEDSIDPEFASDLYNYFNGDEQEDHSTIHAIIGHRCWIFESSLTSGIMGQSGSHTQLSRRMSLY
jgi:hypothetical protein